MRSKKTRTGAIKDGSGERVSEAAILRKASGQKIRRIEGLKIY